VGEESKKSNEKKLLVFPTMRSIPPCAMPIT